MISNIKSIVPVQGLGAEEVTLRDTILEVLALLNNCFDVKAHFEFINNGTTSLSYLPNASS